MWKGLFARLTCGVYRAASVDGAGGLSADCTVVWNASVKKQRLYCAWHILNLCLLTWDYCCCFQFFFLLVSFNRWLVSPSIAFWVISLHVKWFYITFHKTFTLTIQWLFTYESLAGTGDCIQLNHLKKKREKTWKKI